MLDIDTLRAAAAAVSGAAFLLIYFGTYRSTKAPYAGWWALVVALAGASAIAYLLATTSLHDVAGVLGNGLGVAAGAAVWGGARSLRGLRTPWWWIVVAGLAMIAAHAIERPTGAGWPAGIAGPLAMSILVGLATFELIRLVRNRPELEGHSIGAEAFGALVAVTVAVGVTAAFYALRLLTHLTLGPESDLFVNWFGPAPTNLSICVTMVVITYSVALLSRYETAQAWRLRAIHDDLTGLLTRDPFRERVENVLAGPHSTDAMVLLCDFDHFKKLNDSLGHAMGDRALKAFGDACRRELGEDDLASRWGGEEFLLFLADGGVKRAQHVAVQLSKGVAGVVRKGDTPMTVSYGMASAPRDIAFDPLVQRADEALYRAKAAGRDRTVVYGES